MVSTANGAQPQQFIWELKWRNTTPGVGIGAEGALKISINACSISASVITLHEQTIMPTTTCAFGWQHYSEGTVQHSTGVER